MNKDIKDNTDEEIKNKLNNVVKFTNLAFLVKDTCERTLDDINSMEEYFYLDISVYDEELEPFETAWEHLRKFIACCPSFNGYITNKIYEKA